MIETAGSIGHGCHVYNISSISSYNLEISHRKLVQSKESLSSLTVIQIKPSLHCMYCIMLLKMVARHTTIHERSKK